MVFGRADNKTGFKTVWMPSFISPSDGVERYARGVTIEGATTAGTRFPTICRAGYTASLPDDTHVFWRRWRSVFVFALRVPHAFRLGAVFGFVNGIIATFAGDLGQRNARIVRRGPAVLTDGAKEHRADNLVVHHLSVVDRLMTAFWAARVVGHVRYVSGENGLPTSATAAAAIFTTLNPQVA